MNRVILVILAFGLALVAGVVISVPAWASNEQVASKPLVMPQVTPQPEPTPTPTSFAAFATALCDSGQPEFRKVHQREDSWALSWRVDDDSGEWDEIPAEYQDFAPVFRMERALDNEDGSKSLDFEQLGTVTGSFTWTGPLEVGEWIYQLSLVSIHAGGESLDCAEPLSYDSVFLRYEEPPTEEDLYRYAQTLCGDLVITNLEGIGYLEHTELYWDVDLEHGGGDVFPAFVLAFDIEWRAQGEDAWALEELVAYDNRWDWDHYWKGDAVPGIATFQVAVKAVGFGEDEIVWTHCPGAPHFTGTEVENFTQEEREMFLAEREILRAEATRCAREALTQNLSPEALPVVEKYVDDLVAKSLSLDQDETDNTNLATYTMMFCSLRQGGATSGVDSWVLLLLFDNVW